MSKYILKKPDMSYEKQIMLYKEELVKNNSYFAGTSQLNKYDNVEKWILNCKLFETKETCPPIAPIAHQYIYVDEEKNEIVGMIVIRVNAMEYADCREYGGHIGYSVLPSRRRQGIGTQMLKDCLKICKNTFGLDRVMVNCFRDNEASEKIILANGGIFDKEVYYKPKTNYIKRYWINLK